MRTRGGGSRDPAFERCWRRVPFTNRPFSVVTAQMCCMHMSNEAVVISTADTMFSNPHPPPELEPASHKHRDADVHRLSNLVHDMHHPSDFRWLAVIDDVLSTSPSSHVLLVRQL